MEDSGPKYGVIVSTYGIRSVCVRICDDGYPFCLHLSNCSQRKVHMLSVAATNGPPRHKPRYAYTCEHASGKYLLLGVLQCFRLVPCKCSFIVHNGAVKKTDNVQAHYVHMCIFIEISMSQVHEHVFVHSLDKSHLSGVRGDRISPLLEHCLPFSSFPVSAMIMTSMQ